MNILIAEAGTNKNVGSMALIENAIKIARKHYPGCRVTVLCQTVESVRETIRDSGLAENVEVMNDLMIFPTSHTPAVSKLRWLAGTLLWVCWVRMVLWFTSRPSCLMTGTKKTTLAAVEKADMIFCIGAERINDIYFKTAFLSLEVLDIYQKMKKKLIHFSLTIGPVFNKSTIGKARKVLNNSHAIFVRDSKSFGLLAELGVTRPHAFNSFDIAILQEPCPATESLAVLAEYGIDPGKPFIGVSVIDWSFKKTTGPSKDPEYVASFASTLDYLAGAHGFNIVFIPTVIDRNNPWDDVVKSKQIQSRMKHAGSSVIIDRILRPGQLAGVYARCQFAIVTRMHAAILCTGAGQKPVVAVNYLYKLREYMKNIEFENSSVDIDHVTPDNLRQMSDDMLAHYSQHHQQLTTRMNELKDRLNQDISSVKY